MRALYHLRHKYTVVWKMKELHHRGEEVETDHWNLTPVRETVILQYTSPVLYRNTRSVCQQSLVLPHREWISVRNPPAVVIPSRGRLVNQPLVPRISEWNREEHARAGHHCTHKRYLLPQKVRQSAQRRTTIPIHPSVPTSASIPDMTESVSSDRRVLSALSASE